MSVFHLKGGLTLERMLQRYISEEIVHDIDCMGCSKNRKPIVRTTFRKKLTIGKVWFSCIVIDISEFFLNLHVH